MRESAAVISDLPPWVPANMRCTATPLDRLQALLSTLPALARNDDRATLVARAKKIQHICLQLKPAMNAAVPDEPARQRELLDALSLSAAFLESIGRRAIAYDAVISSIYICAALLVRATTEARDHRRPRVRVRAPQSAALT